MDCILLLTTKLPNSGFIPHYTKIKPLLNNLFVSETGPAQMLITHYYITGQDSCNVKFLYDPTERLNWCILRLPYFSSIGKCFRLMRNNLVHNNIVNMKDFIRMINVLVDFSKKITTADYILELLLEKLAFICNIILDNEKFCDAICPLCGSQITSNSYANTAESSKLISLNKNVDDIPNSSFGDKSNSLRYWKENGYKEILKGRTIKIDSGDYKEKIATFRSWSGTTVYVDINGIGRKSLRIDTLIFIPSENGS